MASEPKRIGLFGMFGTGNIGNDGSLESMVRFLRRVAPEERLLCICGNPAAVEKAFGLEAVPIYRRPSRLSERRAIAFLQRAAGRALLWFHAARQLRRLKVLIIPGMGVLDDFSVNPLGLGWPHDVLSWCLLGRLMGVKVILASIGAGPIRHPVPMVAQGGRARRSLPLLSRHDLEGLHGEHRLRRAPGPDLPGHRVPAARPAIDPPA
jgi:polysaccharide pyruvyl transferase WcaK-like protein